MRSARNRPVVTSAPAAREPATETALARQRPGLNSFAAVPSALTSRNRSENKNQPHIINTIGTYSKNGTQTNLQATSKIVHHIQCDTLVLRALRRQNEINQTNFHNTQMEKIKRKSKPATNGTRRERVECASVRQRTRQRSQTAHQTASTWLARRATVVRAIGNPSQRDDASRFHSCLHKIKN